MGITLTVGSLVAAEGQTISLSRVLAVPAASSDPTYLVLNAFDRNEYVAGDSGATGSFSGGFSGSNTTVQLSSLGGDARGAGIVFTYQASTGRYSSVQLGYLDQLSYTISASPGDVTDLSLFGTNSARVANNYANNALSLAQIDASGYLGTLTVTSVPGRPSTVPSQATPQELAAVADSFVGQAWNSDGCWTLASSIAALAGASLPVQSTADIAAAANGEWFVAYDGLAGATGQWQSTVRAGDVIGFVSDAGTGHITTCVSGVGSTAQLVDNITYLNSQGTILDAANDGSSNDVIIQAAHPASQEWSGVSASSVVIYRLDTPLVSMLLSTLSIAIGGTAALSAALAASDPAGRIITSYQAYSANAADGFTIGGAYAVATSAASAVTASSLSQIIFDHAASPIDTISVRAFNGTYWGDWTSIGVSSPATGSNPTSTSPAPTLVTAPAYNDPAMLSPQAATIPVFRFFDRNDGTHFFTASTTERDSLLASRPDLSYEGVGLDGYATAQATSATEAVYRFFDAADGTHFFTASSSERDTLLATRSDMAFEGTSFYEDSTLQAGDVAVFRFYDSTHGTHLFTQSADERASILATRPDLVPEGIAFYAPS